jgi:crotonobetainyl-CoA:carnitine CoA-transferase CaiB-like acyl-CoA transferase
LFALDGVTVVDITVSVAGPYCTQILGALGADVIKVERTERGDDARAWGPPFWNGESAAFLANNANKRSLALDLKAPRGREIVMQLVEGADVLVQNLRPGAAQDLGLGFADVRERNPRIIYCSIGAYGSRGPLSNRPGYDPLMQAAGGIMSITGEKGRPPSRAGVSLVDQGTGMWAVIGILAALRARESEGRAQLVETSLYETAVNWAPYHLLGYLASGVVPEPQGSSMGIIAPYQAFEAKDGWVMVAAGNDRQFRILCGVLEDENMANDPRFATNSSRITHREELATRLAARFSEADSAAWVQRLGDAGVPVAPVLNLAEVAEDEQLKSLGLLQPMAHEKIPDLRLVAPPLSFEGERVKPRSAPPSVGANSREILVGLGYQEKEVQVLFADGVVG